MAGHYFPPDPAAALLPGLDGVIMLLGNLQLRRCVLGQPIVLTLAKSTGASALIMRTSSSDFIICRPSSHNSQPIC